MSRNLTERTATADPRRETRAGGARLLTVREVARLLAVSERLVQSLAQRGDLQAIRVGRLLRFRLEDVETFVTRGATSGR